MEVTVAKQKSSISHYNGLRPLAPISDRKCLGNIMEARAEELLRMPDDDLFAHGGCHIFARVLHRQYGHPLISVRDDRGRHNHVACLPEEDFILDVYGWWSRRAYVEKEGIDIGIGFSLLRLDELEKQFVFTRGQGFYAHQDFVVPASERAKKWIVMYSAYFDGTKKCPIPGLSRVKTTSRSELASHFQK